MITNFIQLDFNKENDLKVPSVQYDSGSRFVKVKLQRNKVPFEINGYRVTVVANKADGTEIMNDCTVLDGANGLVEFEITEQFNAVEGVVDCQLKLFKDETLLTSMPFSISVVKSVSTKEIVSSNELKTLVNALGEVQNIDNRFAQTNAQLSELANKGTTVEVIERATREEIDRQIKDGTMANLTLADNSITEAKLKDNAITTNKIQDGSITIEKLSEDIELEPPLNSVTLQKLDLVNFEDTLFDKLTIDVSSYNNTTEYETYPLYMYENTSVQSETTNIECSCTLYSNSNATIRVSAKLFNNNNSDTSALTGGQSLTSDVVINLSKGFNVFKTTFKNVSLNYTKYRFMPFIRFFKNSDESKIDIYLTDVKFNNNNFNLITKKSHSNNAILTTDTLLPSQPIVPSRFKNLLCENQSLITDFVEEYSKESKMEIYVPNIHKVNGGIAYPTVALDLSVRDVLAEYEYKIPKGTKFNYTISVETNEGSLNQIGLQIFQAKNPNDSKFDSKVGYVSFPKVNLNGLSSYTFTYELVNDTSFAIQDGYYIKLFVDTTYQTGVDFKGSLIYTDMDIKLPTGESIFKPVAVNNDSSLEPAYIAYSSEKLITYDFFGSEVENINDRIDSEIEKILLKIADSKRVPSRWTDKRYTSVGDSITWQHEKTNYLPDNTPLKGYQHYVNQRLGIATFVNNGVSGMTMAQYEGWSNSFMTRYKTINWADFDLVTIALGTNDYGNGGGCQVGEVDSTDISTYCGAYNTVLEYIFKINPKIRIVLMTPFQRSSGNNTNSKGHKLIDYVNAVVDLGEKWSCPVFDCYRLAGWNKGTFSIYTVDGLHGSADGFESVGVPLGEFLAMN